MTVRAQTARPAAADKESIRGNLLPIIDTLSAASLRKLSDYAEDLREEDEEAEFEAVKAEIAALEAKYGTTPNEETLAAIAELRNGEWKEFSSIEELMADLNDDSDD
jgi:hypothetical protein